MENSYTAVGLGKNAKLVVDNGTVLVRGKYDKAGLFAYGDNSTIHIKNNSHVEATTITLNPSIKKIPTVGQKLIVTGGTLTYDYKADNTLWPVNDQGDKLTNFLLTKDDAHANFDALSYKGQTYTYLSDLNKETGKQYLSVWVPAAALNYMLDVDGSHDPEIIGKVLEELKQAGYNFDTAYQTAENGDQVVILRDMVVNGKSLNFTKTTDAEGNTKLIWGNYEKQAEGAPSAYDMVYGTEYEYEGKTYTIVWGYESQNNPNTTAAAGVLDAGIGVGGRVGHDTGSSGMGMGPAQRPTMSSIHSSSSLPAKDAVSRSVSSPRYISCTIRGREKSLCVYQYHPGTVGGSFVHTSPWF